MKKTALAIVIILLVAIAGAIYYVFSNLDAIVKAAIESYGSDAVKTAVRVEDVAIRLTEGAATINGLTIANPDGFVTPLAFSLGEITVDINLEKTEQALVAIDAINIIAPEVFYEINAERKGSLNVLKDNPKANRYIERAIYHFNGDITLPIAVRFVEIENQGPIADLSIWVYCFDGTYFGM